jgi:2-dehydro-3-deoxy-D-arabinonate dehydratase
MQLIKFSVGGQAAPQVGLIQGDSVVSLGSGPRALSDLLHSPSVEDAARALVSKSTGVLSIGSIQILAPIDEQEVWGAGVTYERSKHARELESEKAASFYDLVYRADRPELFFKATPSRVVGPGEPVRVRYDSNWSVPEPELALVLNPSLELVGFTIGNDMSARDIEGVNPLYLPQAKLYSACCALGPCITLTSAMPPLESIAIGLEIERGGKIVFEGKTSVGRMARRLEELIGWLSRENHFPDGVILLTGTGIIPPDEFSLESLDLVRMSIDGIGTLSNPVVKRT